MDMYGSSRPRTQKSDGEDRPRSFSNARLHRDSWFLLARLVSLAVTRMDIYDIARC